MKTFVAENGSVDSLQKYIIMMMLKVFNLAAMLPKYNINSKLFFMLFSWIKYLIWSYVS